MSSDFWDCDFVLDSSSMVDNGCYGELIGVVMLRE